jgi:hypothetical protein
MIIRRAAFVLAALLWACVAASAAEPLDKRSFEDLSRLFQESDVSLRVSIAEVWGKRREAKAVGVLARALGADGSAEVRTKAAWALGAMGAEGALDALRRSVQGDAESSVRYMAAWALGRLGNRDATLALSRALEDRDTAVRAQAAKSLGRLGDRAAVPALRRTLRDRAPQVRTAAVLALQRLGLSDAAIRRDLPREDAGGAIVAERKSQGAGIALGFLGAGLIYADRPVLGWTTLGLELAGIGLMLVASSNGAFRSELVCPETGMPPSPGAPCAGLPVDRDLKPGYKTLFITGLIVAAGAWLTSVVGTPLAITSYNNRIDEAKRAQVRFEPFFELRADAKVVGATIRF